MRKLLWTLAIVALLGGMYWSIAHAHVHPDSPVGRCLAWFGVAPKSTPVPCINRCEVRCTSELTEGPLCIAAEQPAGLIRIEPDFPRMTDPDGNDPVVVIGSTEPVREVVLPGEEVRLMPGVDDEASPMTSKDTNHGVRYISLAECVAMALAPRNEFKVDCPPESCLGKCACWTRLMTATGAWGYLMDRASGGCPFCCPKAKPEPIREMPAAVEECEPAPCKMMNWLQWGRCLQRANVDTMEARPADVNPAKSRPSPD
jgi:hypothetical protein